MRLEAKEMNETFNERYSDAANKWVLRKSNVAYTSTDAKRQRNVLLLLLLL